MPIRTPKSKKATEDDYSFESFFSTVESDLQLTFSEDYAGKNIIEFLDTEVDKSKEGWGIDLTHRQRLILKTFYGLELTYDDEILLEAWKASDRTTYDINESPRRRQALLLECGRRGSKTAICSVILAYEWYKLCMRPNPQNYYGVASSTLVSIICLATTADQAKQTIYGQSRALLYYVPKIRKLIDDGKIVVGEEQIKYTEKLLYIYSGNSKASSQVGGACILLILDEAAMFEDPSGESNARALWDDLGISGLTFGNDALQIAISSASHEGDAIQLFYNDAKRIPDWVGYRFRSWDLNPEMASRTSKFISAKYLENPTRAALHFEGIRTTSQYIFFDKEYVLRAFTGRSTIDCERLAVEADKLVRLNITKVLPCARPTYMHLDPAITGDNYGLAFGHSEMSSGRLIVYIDGLLAWEPESINHVSVTNVQAAIYAIHAKRPLTKVSADHAQQAETLQRLKAAGIPTETLFASNKLQLEMYSLTADLLNEGRLILPKDSKWTQLAQREFLTIERKKDKIDHPSGGSKDLTDCICSVVWHLAGSSQDATMPKVFTGLPAQQTSLAPQMNLSDDGFTTSRGSYHSEFLTRRNRYSGRDADF